MTLAVDPIGGQPKPKEIIVHTAVRSDPVTERISEKCPDILLKKLPRVEGITAFRKVINKQ